MSEARLLKCVCGEYHNEHKDCPYCQLAALQAKLKTYKEMLELQVEAVITIRTQNEELQAQLASALAENERLKGYESRDIDKLIVEASKLRTRCEELERGNTMLNTAYIKTMAKEASAQQDRIDELELRLSGKTFDDTEYQRGLTEGWKQCAEKAKELYLADEVVRENLMQTIHVTQVLRDQVADEEKCREEGYQRGKREAYEDAVEVLEMKQGAFYSGKYQSFCTEFNITVRGGNNVWGNGADIIIKTKLEETPMKSPIKIFAAIMLFCLFIASQFGVDFTEPCADTGFAYAMSAIVAGILTAISQSL